MATGDSQTDIEAFYDFISRIRQSGIQDLSPEDSVRHFRAYQEELKKFRSDTEVSLEQSRRGESKPLDDEAFMARVRKRLAEEGISD